MDYFSGKLFTQVICEKHLHLETKNCCNQSSDKLFLVIKLNLFKIPRVSLAEGDSDRSLRCLLSRVVRKAD